MKKTLAQKDEVLSSVSSKSMEKKEASAQADQLKPFLDQLSEYLFGATVEKEKGSAVLLEYWRSLTR